MKLKSAIKFQLSDMLRPVAIFYAIIYAIMLLLYFTLVNVGGSSNGLESASMIFIFVLGLNAFKAPFMLFLQNGVSRKTLLKSFLMSILCVAAIMAVVDSVNGLINNSILPNYTTFFETFYAPRYANMGAFIKLLDGFVWSIALYLLFGMIGFAITNLYYRMSKWLKLAVSVGVPALLFVILPLVDAIVTNGAINRVIGGCFAFGFANGNNPYYAVVSCLVLSTIFAGVSYLLIRGATVKD